MNGRSPGIFRSIEVADAGWQQALGQILLPFLPPLASKTAADGLKSMGVVDIPPYHYGAIF